MSDSSLKIYYGTEEGRNMFAALFPCNLRQRRFWASRGFHGGEVEEAVHLAYDSVSLRLSSRTSRPWRWQHGSSKRRRLHSDAFTYSGSHQERVLYSWTKTQPSSHYYAFLSITLKFWIQIEPYSARGRSSLSITIPKAFRQLTWRHNSR
jgi:hypothetical protein